MKQPKTLLFDIETAPGRGFAWGDRSHEVDIIEWITFPYILSYAYKWLGERKIHVKALPDFPGYRRGRECDKALIASLRALLDTADVVVAHNGNKFDLRFANTRALVHGLLPPEPYKSIDTLVAARKYYRFSSNRLDALGDFLGVGRKLPHTGFHLWARCMDGDPKAWVQMRRYNATDVALLERVYLKLRPWMTNHPALSHYTKRFDECPVCQSGNIESRGWGYSRTGKRRRKNCRSCGHWFTVGGLVKE